MTQDRDYKYKAIKSTHYKYHNTLSSIEGLGADLGHDSLEETLDELLAFSEAIMKFGKEEVNDSK